MNNLSPTSRRRARAAIVACAFTVSLTSFAANMRAQYDAPASYYALITNQTGAALKEKLTTIMSTGHNQTSYADARDYLPFTDALPTDATKMYEYYTRVVIQKPSASTIGFTGIYTSREHVWPDSLQGTGNTSNATKGSRGDIHILKPASSAVNGDRGNAFYGGATLTGTQRLVGGLYFPGDFDKGDAARMCLYAATRYSSTLSLINGSSGTNTQMGDLNSMLHWNYQDVPDLFEQRRNDVIYRGDDIRTPGDDSPFVGTNNRNAYIDHPEYVWSVYANQTNDSQLSVATADADGGSAKTVNLGRVLRNAPVPAGQSVTISKAGLNGTFYSVTPSGGATSSITGHYNAFVMDSTGSATMNVGLNASTATPSLQSGTVTVDNLDVTTEGGAGHGANDANDVVSVQLSVLASSNGSFVQGSDVDALNLDFGTVAQGGSRIRAGSIANLASTYGASLTAGLDLDSIVGSGDATTFSTGLSSFAALAAGGVQAFDATIDAATRGDFTATYTLNVSDENLPGTQTTGQLLLTLHGKVALGGDTDYSGTVDFADLLALAKNYGTTTTGGTTDGTTDWSAGDFNDDAIVDFADLLLLAKNYGSSGAAAIDLPPALASDWALAQALVPEPTSVFGVIALGVLARRRRA